MIEAKELGTEHKTSLTVIIAAKNEALNIEKCLRTVSAARRIVVIDSGSTDDTALIVRSLGAEIVQFQYSGHYPKKRQWALSNLEIATEWVLLLDADEVIPVELWNEIEHVVENNGPYDGYFINKGYHFLGKKFTYGGFSFDAMLLFRNGVGKFENLADVPETGLDMEVHERVIVNGKTGRLRTPLIHNDFKGLQAYVDRHNKYSTWEAHLRMAAKNFGKYGQKDAIPAKFFGDTQSRRRFLKKIAMAAPCEAALWFLYHYVIRGGFLEGTEGLIASTIRAGYIALIHAKMFELRRKNE